MGKTSKRKSKESKYQKGVEALDIESGDAQEPLPKAQIESP